MTTETTDIEDVAASIAAGRKPRAQGPYRMEVGDAELAFRPVRIEDPVPTGRQVLEAAGTLPALPGEVLSRNTPLPHDKESPLPCFTRTWRFTTARRSKIFTRRFRRIPRPGGWKRRMCCARW